MSSRSFFISFIFVIIYILGFSNTTDSDFFWHIKTGKILLDTGFPQGDPFSFTKLGSFWHLHEWLSEVLMYFVYSNFPHWVLSALFSCFSLVSFLLVYKRCEEKPYIACIATFIPAYVSSISWGIRPQVFNMLGASLFIFILDKIRKGEYGPKSFLILFPTLIIWVNLHAGAVLGCLLVIFYVTLNFIVPYKKELKVNSMTTLGLISLSLICLLLSPYGFGSFFYTFETLTSSAMREHISEWNSPNFHTSEGAAFFVLVISTFLLLLISTKKPSLSDGILILGSLTQAFMSYRNITFFCICIGPFLSSLLGDLFSKIGSLSNLVKPKPRYESTKIKLIFTILIICFALQGLSLMAGIVKQENEYIKTALPVDAVVKLKELNPKRVYNYYSWGGYLIWNNIPVFIDGRADVYGDEFFNKYINIAKTKEGAYETLESFDVEYVIFPTDSGLIPFLKSNKEYQEIYKDKLATILKKKT